MINFDDVPGENVQKHSRNWLQISDYLYRILIVGSPVSRKTNALLNLIYRQPDIDKNHFYAKDLY